MLLLAVAAGWWARPSEGKRSAAVVLGAVCVFAAVSYGVSAVRQNSVQAPEFINVDGKPFALREGRVFLFFFNPECIHCDRAARELGKLAWGATKVVGVPTQMPQFGPEFMNSTNLRGLLSSDAEPLREVFIFTEVPYGVALENGRLRAALSVFDATEPEQTLRKLGFVR
jgi:thiol-disulfide isomerase/thioredoxin